MIYEAFDIVVVPFPFVDKDAAKRRPAIVVSSLDSFGKKSKHSVLAMITSAKHASWSLDIKITDLSACNLNKESIVRMKLFTLDNRLILRKSGRLAMRDRGRFSSSMQQLFSIVL